MSGDFDGSNRDWLRAMLADDVRLTQSAYPVRTGPTDVGRFFRINSRSPPVRLAPGWLDSREVIAVYEDLEAAKPSYMMWLESRQGMQLSNSFHFRRDIGAGNHESLRLVEQSAST